MSLVVLHKFMMSDSYPFTHKTFSYGQRPIFVHFCKRSIRESFGYPCPYIILCI